jgi:hypothetical protein
LRVNLASWQAELGWPSGEALVVLSRRAPSLTGPLSGMILCLPFLRAEPVAVHHLEGTVHGFLALSTMDSKILAPGDLIQVIRGNQVVSRLVFRFKDGSLDDETAIFAQRGSLRLVSDHHIQKGPAFPHPMDVLITASTGQVTVRFMDDHGREKVEMDHLDLPPDLANGIVLNILKNIRPETKETKMSYVAATPKPRLVKLSIVLQREETFWVAGGEAPTFVKLEGPLYLGGPIWRIQLMSPVWRRSQQKSIPDHPQNK